MFLVSRYIYGPAHALLKYGGVPCNAVISRSPLVLSQVQRSFLFFPQSKKTRSAFDIPPWQYINHLSVLTVYKSSVSVVSLGMCPVQVIQLHLIEHSRLVHEAGFVSMLWDPTVFVYCVFNRVKSLLLPVQATGIRSTAWYFQASRDHSLCWAGLGYMNALAEKFDKKGLKYLVSQYGESDVNQEQEIRTEFLLRSLNGKIRLRRIRHKRENKIKVGRKRNGFWRCRMVHLA